MSEQQVERLQALLETVQKNRQKPGQAIGPGASAAAASVVQNRAPANMTDELSTANLPGAAADIARMREPAQPEPPTAVVGAPAAAAPPLPAPPARREPPAPAKPQPRAPEPAPAVQPEAIVPRLVEPDAPQPATRPIAQLVSKHAPVVDATFGAMLKRSLSLRPH